MIGGSATEWATAQAAGWNSLHNQERTTQAPAGWYPNPQDGVSATGAALQGQSTQRPNGSRPPPRRSC